MTKIQLFCKIVFAYYIFVNQLENYPVYHYRLKYLADIKA